MDKLIRGDFMKNICALTLILFFSFSIYSAEIINIGNLKNEALLLNYYEKIFEKDLTKETVLKFINEKHRVKEKVILGKFLFQKKNDLHAALELCGDYKKNQPCWYGAFSEFAVYFKKSHGDKQKFIQELTSIKCYDNQENSTKPKAVEHGFCYHGFGQAFYSYTEGSITKAQELCSDKALNQKFRPFCVCGVFNRWSLENTSSLLNTK